MLTPAIESIVQKFPEPKLSALKSMFEESTLKEAFSYLVTALPIISTPLTSAEKTTLMNLAGATEIEEHLVDLIKNSPVVDAV